MPKQSTIRMRSYVTTVTVCGLAVIAFAATHLKTLDVAHFAGLLCAAALASRLSIKVPRVDVQLGLDVPFVVLAAVQMGLAAAVSVAAVSTFIQCVKPNFKKSELEKLFFNTANLSIAAAVAAVSANVFTMTGIKFAVAGVVLLAVNSLLLAIVIGLDSNGKPMGIWSHLMTWSFPAYLMAAGMACMMLLSQPVMGWYVPLLSMPVMVVVYRSYQRYFGVVVTTAEEGQVEKEESVLEEVHA
jgi:hypothetical protein